MKTILQQALTQVNPAYFDWSKEQQDEYGVRLPKEDERRIRQIVYRELFGVEAATEQEQDAAYDALSPAQFDPLNHTLSPLMGIGEDSFYLNEYLSNTTLLDYDTVYDYDIWRFGHGEAVQQQEDPDYKAKPYQGQLYHLFARLMKDGELQYLQFVSRAEYLFHELMEAGQDHIKTLIPYHYVPGKEDGKRVGRGILCDRKRVANGLEGQLDELRHRFFSYLMVYREHLIDRCDKEALGKVYTFTQQYDFDTTTRVIFSDKTALQAVRFKHFVRDCQDIAGDEAELAAFWQQEHDAILAYLDATYQDVMATYDPKLIKLRKKRKIVLSDKAVDDLSKL